MPDPSSVSLPLDRPGVLDRILAVYRPDPASGLHEDRHSSPRALARLRLRMFLGFFLGYALLYFCRKNISTSLKPMSDELGYSNVELGLIGTTLYVTYGIGKFANGVLADRSNIRTFMATALIASGAINLAFGSLSSLWILAAVWGLNGWFQSMGFPPIARGMTLWFPPEGKATRWAFWTCSHQAGTAAVMGLTALLLAFGNWRLFFWVPGALNIAAGIGLLFLLADTPESRGFPSAQAFDEPAAAGEGYRATFIKHVLLNRNVWAIGLIDLCVYVVRYGTLDWASKFLEESKGYGRVGASWRAGLMPLAGVAGVLASGFIADVLFKTRYKAVNAVCLAMLALSMYGLVAIGPGHPVLDLVFLAGIGFFVEGPQSILGGVGAVDAGGSARVASSAAGLVGILAYAGASLSGIGTGWFIDAYGWQGAFRFWIACSLAGLVLCLALWKEKRR